ADRIERIRLALTAAILTVAAVHLHHPHARPGDVAGPARAQALRPPSTHPVPPRRPVPNPPSQPSRRPYPSGVAGNSCPPSSPPIGSSAAATCTSAWVSTPPVIARVSTMVIAVPFSG